MPAAAGIVRREKGIIIDAAAAKNVLVAHRVACRPDQSAATARVVCRKNTGIIKNIVAFKLLFSTSFRVLLEALLV